MTENKTQGVHKHRTPIPLDNPEIKNNTDWWDEMCKSHGVKNYWAKAKKNTSKKPLKKASKKNKK